MGEDSHYFVRMKETIPSRTQELHRIRQLVESEALEFGFDAEDAFRLALAVDEACTNIIKHSYGGDPTNSFELEIATADSGFRVVLTDSGKGFSPDFENAFDRQRYFEEMCRGGLGLHIMRMVMDDVDYQTMAGSTNRLRMVKYLSKMAAAGS